MKFSTVALSLSNLIDQIELGAIGLPEIQRPFVWKATKVRDLFDSMYRGFPVGFLLLWENLLDPGARQIGTSDKQVVPATLVVDGQQRLTSLYAVMKGHPIITRDFKETRLNIAFRPQDERFDVASAAIRNDPEWISNISDVWDPQVGLISFVSAFTDRLSNYREVEPPEVKDIGEAIQRLFGIRDFHFTALQLASTLDEEQVAEIFVRINSEGIRLRQADFILTLMSVWWEDGRKQLEDFCRRTRQPSTDGSSPFNWFIQPNPDQLLRVSVALAFGRARLEHVYSILRGKDLQTKEFSPERRDRQFETLRQAQSYVLDLTNWHEFFKAISAAGYRSGRMVMSETNLMYSYALYLIGRKDFGVDHKRLREVIARWFYMSSITSRYTGSSETQMEADLARLRGISTADQFVAELDRIADSELTDDQWEIRLPNDLERSGTRSPTLYAYDAALSLLGADVLFSDLKVTDLLDPAVTAKKAAIERHHLFPRAYLARHGIEKTSQVNQIANYALVEWSDNISISDAPPAEYYPKVVQQFSGERLDQMSAWHALPERWYEMDYHEFLEARRVMIAKVIRQGWEKLRSVAKAARKPGQIPPAGVRSTGHWSVDELIHRKESDRVEFKSSARWNYHRGAKGKEIEDAVIKTVAALMNTWGGTLIIGVDDDGAVVGLTKDLSTVKGGNLDGFDLWIHKMLSDAIGVAEVGSLVSVSFVTIDGSDLCRVDVRASQEPVFVNTSKERGVLFVRTGAATLMLTAEEILKYRDAHWSTAKAARPVAFEPASSVQEGEPQDQSSDETSPKPSPDQLEHEFHEAMAQVYQRAKTEAGYTATRFIQMVSEHGGLETAHLLLASDKVSDGFTALWEAKHLELTVEALILAPIWHELFTEAERETAKQRLQDYGYLP